MAVAFLTLAPLPGGTESTGIVLPYADKAVHFVMFGALSAIWWRDWLRNHGLHQTPLYTLIPVVSAVIIAGAIDEVLQGALPIGRTADPADWCADAAGAIVMPILCRRWICRSPRHGVVTLSVLPARTNLSKKLSDIYNYSFPPEEQRDWGEIMEYAGDTGHPLTFLLIERDGKACGFITYWQFDGFRYVEHFAVAAAERGGGIGSMAMMEFLEMGDDAVVLEVEPSANGVQAERRIAFYERCGFRGYPEYHYVQPPYCPGKPEVPLMLMVSATGGCEPDLGEVNRTLRKVVYGVKNG